jgi:Protein of unknown function (DUF1689)
MSEAAKAEVAQNNLRLAERFYESDHELNTAQRQQLATAFTNQLSSIPFGSMPGLVIGIGLPFYAIKYKYLRVNSPRLVQVIGGMVGLIVGSRTASYVSRKRSLAKLEESSSSAVTAFNILYPYPPQIGIAYYTKTVKDAGKIMKDPNTIDWSRELQFPLNLALQPEELERGMHQRRPAPRKPQVPSSQEEYEARQEPTKYEFSWEKAEDQAPTESDEQVNSGKSTWDVIRSQTSGFQGSQKASPQKYPPYPVSSKPREDDNSDWFSTLPARPARQPGEMTSDQNEFDRELELERQGFGVKDDFTSSEKKWK